MNVFFWDWFIARLAKRAVPGLIKSASASVVLIIAFTGIVGVVFGRDVTGIWATSGALGLVLGFALRGVLQDIFTGIAMNVEGAIKAGDWIEINSSLLGERRCYGKVLDIGWRATSVQLENNNVLIIPNGVMGATAITNFAHAGQASRMETEIVIDFDVPPERARRILLAGARAAFGAPGIVATPPPAVLIGEPTESGVAYKVRFWGRVSESSLSTMQDAVMTQLLRHLRVAGLTPAYPKEDLFIQRRPKRLLDHEMLDDRLEILSRIDLFGRSLEPQELELLASETEATVFEPGQTLVHQGDAGSSLFVVAEGYLDVFVSRDDDPAPVLVNHIGAGQIFGEMSLLTGAPRSASVVANTGVVAYEVKRAVFEQILASRPAIAEQVSAIVAQHRTRTDSALREVAATEVEQEARRIKEQILERMGAVFRIVTGGRTARTG
jgi:small-conductance mechanosensitive channel/CRP-like cAMP-binding protein